MNMRRRQLLSSSVLLISLFSCASEPLLPPGPLGLDAYEFYNTFPKLTVSSYYEDVDAAISINANKCKPFQPHLIRARIGTDLAEDMRNGAAQIDRAVIGDGGDAYVINTYEWVPVREGATELNIQITSLLCGI